MKSKYYYGIGNDEYNYWKTTDNGKTWNYWKEGNGKVIIDNEKITESINIPTEGGTTREEIRTSKDNGDTWEKESDGRIIDGLPLYIEKDNKIIDKETGEEIGSGPVNKVYEENDKIIIQGDDTRIIIDKETGERTIETIDFQIDDLLLYILNKVMIPKLSFVLLGEKELNSIKYDPYDDNDTYYTNSQLYLVNPEMIDYLIDVGMRPLSLKDLPEYKENEKLKEELNYQLTDTDIEEEKINERLLVNKSLSNSFNMIDILINTTKDYILRDELKRITDLEEDYEGLLPEEVSLMKMYYDLAKGSKESIIGTIINSIFTFNNSKKMALLKTSIIKTIINIKERIKIKIELLKDKVIISSKEEIINNKYFKNMLKINLKKEWSIALKQSLNEYYNTAMKNIMSMTSNNDKDIISIAADKYKEYRLEFLDIASSTLNDLYISENSSIINELNDLLNSGINKFINNVNSIIKGSDVKNELYKLLNDYKEEEKAILKKSETIYFNMLQSAAGRFEETLNIININNYGFDEDDYSESLEDLEYSSQIRVYNYYNEIIKKFKERCKELYILAGSNIVETYVKDSLTISNDLSNWINNLLINGNYEEYIKSNTLSYLKDNGLKTTKDFYKLTKQEWNNSKEVI